MAKIKKKQIVKTNRKLATVKKRRGLRLLTITNVLNGPKLEMIKWLQRVGVLKESFSCDQCGSVMKLERSRSRIGSPTDEYHWSCDNGHVKLKPVREQSVFQYTELPMEQIIMLMYFWAYNYPFKNVLDETSLPKKTVKRWLMLCEEACMDILIENDNKLGGPGSIIEIQEGKLGERVITLDKTTAGQAVFGVIDAGNGNCFLHLVNGDKKMAFLTLLKERIAPNTRIRSECWKLYNCFDDENFKQVVSECALFVNNESPKMFKSFKPQKALCFDAELCANIYKTGMISSVDFFQEFLRDIGCLYRGEKCFGMTNRMSLVPSLYDNSSQPQVTSIGVSTCEDRRECSGDKDFPKPSTSTTSPSPKQVDVENADSDVEVIETVSGRTAVNQNAEPIEIVDHCNSQEGQEDEDIIVDDTDENSNSCSISVTDEQVDPEVHRKRLFVGNLSKNIGKTFLGAYFSTWGKPRSIKIYHRERSLFGVLQFSSKKAVDTIQERRPHMLDQNIRLITYRGSSVDINVCHKTALMTKVAAKVPAENSELTIKQVKEYFSKYGLVSNCTCSAQAESGENRTTGNFSICFKDYDSADKACLESPHKIGNVENISCEKEFSQVVEVLDVEAEDNSDVEVVEDESGRCSNDIVVVADDQPSDERDQPPEHGTAPKREWYPYNNFIARGRGFPRKRGCHKEGVVLHQKALPQQPTLQQHYSNAFHNDVTMDELRPQQNLASAPFWVTRHASSYTYHPRGRARFPANTGRPPLYPHGPPGFSRPSNDSFGAGPSQRFNSFGPRMYSNGTSHWTAQ